jgi:low affinity Fe/Cu permease
MRMLVFPQLSAERISRNLASLTAFICRVQLVREEAVSTKNVGTTGRSGPFSKLFGEIANRTSKAAGHALTFVIAASIVLVWALSGPLFQYSDTWQLVINTGTTIVTFLMVFLIQNSQNRDSAAIQVKLDELIRVSTAHNSFVGIEHLTDEELEEIRNKCESRAEAEKAGEATVEKIDRRARRAATNVDS